MDIKSILKKSRIIYGLNARIKAALMTRATVRLNSIYTRMAEEAGVKYDREGVLQSLRNRMSKRGVLPGRTSPGRLRIFSVGTNKEQDYSGYIQGLHKFGDVIQFVNQHGGYGLEANSSTLSPTVREANSHQLLKQIDAVYDKGGKIDVLIGQMWASHLTVNALKKVQEKGIITVGISMDDRLPVLWEGESPRGLIGLVNGLDLVLTSCSDCCVRYLLAGCPAIFWPMASDPDIFKPALNKDIDVSFVGNNYGSRGEIIRALMNNGVNVEAYGAGWPNGYVGPHKIAEVFGRSKIILGIGTVGYSKDIFTLKLRDFDATMAGSLYLTHRNPDLTQIFEEGREIECYSNEAEAIDKIIFYLQHPDKREKIAAAGYLTARRAHTWQTRLSEAFSMVDLILPGAV